MLNKRIIPCLDVKNGRVVKGIHFQNLKDAGDPVDIAAFYSKQGADELVFLDITATIENRGTVIDMVKRTAKKVFIPFTVGGGIKNVNDMRELLSAGADKVSINSIAVKNPKLISESAKLFGSQCIVVAIDAKKIVQGTGYRVQSEKQKKLTPYTLHLTHNSKWEVVINAGNTPTGIDAVKWAKKAESLGAGEILLTSMDADGTKDGYDIELNKAVSEAVHIPVIASGGAGNLEHLYKVLKYGKTDAVLAASIFHYGIYTIKKAKQYLKKRNIVIRI